MVFISMVVHVHPLQVNFVNCLESTLSNFDLVTADELSSLIMKYPPKSCDLDPMPTWLVKKHLPTIIPVLLRIINGSLSTGVFPAELR